MPWSLSLHFFFPWAKRWNLVVLCLASLSTKADAALRVWGNYSHLCLARVMKGWMVKTLKIKGKGRNLQAARRLWMSTSNLFSNQTPLRVKTINKELWAAAQDFSAATSTAVNLLSSSSCLPCRGSTILPGWGRSIWRQHSGKQISRCLMRMTASEWECLSVCMHATF